MNAKAKRLLISWIIHVMYMLCSRADLFSKVERDELAQYTVDLREELKK